MRKTWETDWPWSGGKPDGSAVLRQNFDDFVVTEELGFPADGEGEHAFLYIEKTDQTSDNVARSIARLAGVEVGRVGYCGMKDRRAVCRQFFSIGLAGVSEPDWSQLEVGGIRVLSVSRHRKKLRRGVHRRNHFSLRLRQVDVARDLLETRLENIASNGVPNYFGQQRFGRDFRNLQICERWMSGGKAPRQREQRGMILSAARSWLFNTCLGAAVADDSWNQVSLGDVCMLAGSRSFFVADGSAEDLAQRHTSGDLHRGIPLWGTGESDWCDNAVIKANQRLAEWLCTQRLKLEYRPARLMPDDFSWQFCDHGNLQLDFGLPAGGYATTVVRELVRVEEPGVINQATLL